jgi:dTDP-4-dehydrorhamnose reductase
MNNNILVTGASGLLGRYLLTYSKRPVVGTYWKHPFESGTHIAAWLSLHAQMDIDGLLHAIKPRVVIHCAGQGDVDECQRRHRKSRIINVLGTAHLAKRAMYYGCEKFVYLSTNAVFQGNNAPYFEDDERKPVNVYGTQKMEAENEVFTICGDKALIVRPILLYGWPRDGGRHNWATRIYERLTDGAPVRMVTDRVTQPTYAGDVARAIWRLIDKEASGTYHVGGLDICSLYSFAMETAAVFGLDKNLISPASSSEFPGLAPRPVNTTYNLDRLYNTIEFFPLGIRDGLVRMRDEQIYRTKNPL